MHDMNNVLKQFFKNLGNEMEKINERMYDFEKSKIEKVINGADTRKVRENVKCSKSFNDFIREREPNDVQKKEIAKLKIKGFESLEEIEKTEILSNIKHFPLIKPIFVVRFRSWKKGLEALLANKPNIQEASLVMSVHRELFECGDLDWDLVNALYEIFRKVSEATDKFEQSSASSAYQIQAYIDLIEFSLPKNMATTRRYINFKSAIFGWLF